MSDDLRLDMDHFGNPAISPTYTQAQHDLNNGLRQQITHTGSVQKDPAVTQAEDEAFDALLRKQLDALPPLPGGITFEERVELNQTFGKLGKPSVLYTQIGGDHYKKLGQYQPWQVAAACMTPAELRGYMKGTVLAYLMREADKGGDLDIEKALHTIQLWQEVRKDKPDDK